MSPAEAGDRGRVVLDTQAGAAADMAEADTPDERVAADMAGVDTPDGRVVGDMAEVGSLASLVDELMAQPEMGLLEIEWH